MADPVPGKEHRLSVAVQKGNRAAVTTTRVFDGDELGRGVRRPLKLADDGLLAQQLNDSRLAHEQDCLTDFARSAGSMCALRE